MTIRHLLLLVPLTATLACSTPSGEAVASRRDAVDFETGDVVGAATWFGVPIAELATPLPLAADRTELVARNAAGDFAGGTFFSFGAYSFPNIAAGSLDITLSAYTCGVTDQSLGVEVPAGGIVNGDFALEATGGIVVGTVLVDGAPFPHANVHVEGSCGFFVCGSESCPSSDGEGRFARYLPPGDYSASVYRGQSVVGVFDFSVALGAVTDIGVLGFETGDLVGQATWYGVPVDELAAPAHLVAEQLIDLVASAADGTPAGYTLLDEEGRYSLPDVRAGDLRVGYDVLACGMPESSIDVEVLPGQVTTADLELSLADGIMVGNVSVNGAPLPGPTLRVDAQCGSYACESSSCPGSDDTGAFARVLPPGSYSVRVGSGGVSFGSFDVNIDLGEVTDLGTLDFPTGDVTGTLTWNGVPLTDLEAPLNLAAHQPLTQLVASTASGSVAGIARFDPTGRYTLRNLPAGDVALAFHSVDCNVPDQVVEVAVGAGDALVADLDLAETSGQLIGRISVNGAPLPYPNLNFDGSSCGSVGCSPQFCPASNADGAFARILPPGDYTARVQTGSSVVGWLSFTIRQGELTDVDVGTTEVGFDVLVELSGGVGTPGGITLVFSEVTQAGQTTVVESGAGPPPDTGFRIVGLGGQPRYWDIDTTAEYTPPITVCISYDESEVGGNESNLQLRHDDGSGWEDITTTIDENANVICGEATSLSPFAVFEPIDADADDDGVSDANDRCPETRGDALVDSDGCSLEQLCPCKKRWRNHGEYVTCQRRALREFVADGLLERRDAARLLERAERSSCGKHGPKHRHGRRHR